MAIFEVFKNPDGTYSTKRTMAWGFFICTALVAGVGLFRPTVNETIYITTFTGFLSGCLGSLGITTLDLKHQVNALVTSKKEKE